MNPPTQRSSERELRNLIPPSPAVRPLWGQNREEAAMPQAQNNQDWYGWTPVFLRKKPLIGLLSGFLLILLAIVALAVVDSKHAGVSSAESKIYYLWTYGTTAVMTIVAALWAKVEFRTKQAMPWETLKRRSTPASKTLLMDYLSPSLVESLWGALRRAHWPVAVVITNTLLIQLLTVASTGLLYLQRTPVTNSRCEITASTDFVNEFNTSRIGATPILATLALQNNTIPMPPGTSLKGAYQRLETQSTYSRPSSVQIDGISKSFRADLKCETATVRGLGSNCDAWQCHAFNVTLDITAPGCSISGFNYTTGCGMSLGPTYCDVKSAWTTECDNGHKGQTANRMVFMVGEILQNLSRSHDPIDLLANKTTTILCEPNYEIVDAHVRMDQAGNILEERNFTALKNVEPGFPPWNLIDGLHTSSRAAKAVFGYTYSYSSWSFAPWLELSDLFFNWIEIDDPKGNIKDAEFLKAKVSEVFSIAAAQMAKIHLLKPSSKMQIGQCSVTEDRLRIRGLSLYMMVASLVVLLVLVVLFIYTRPGHLASRDPTTIGGLALVLARSPTILSLFSDKGAVTLKSIRTDLEGMSCRSTFSTNQGQQEFSVQITANNIKSKTAPDSEIPKAATEQIKLWNPVSLHRSFKSLVIASLLVLVILLEVMYWYSKEHNGVAEVNTHSYVRFVWAYVPAIVMLSAHTLVAMVAFSSLQIFPYFQLLKRSPNTWDDASRDYLSKFAVQSLSKSISKHHWSVACMSLTALLGPLLTVVVSGLYTPYEIQSHLGVSLSTADSFNASFKPFDLFYSRAFGPASANVGLLLTQNFSNPLWTYDEFAFPKFNITYPEEYHIPRDDELKSNITMTLPAIRATLDCNLATQYPQNFSKLLGYRSNVSVSAFEHLGCDPTFWPMPDPSTPFGYFSMANPSKLNISYLTLSNTLCGAYGTSETNWRPFVCKNTINQLDVNVTIAASTSIILSATPLDNTTKYFSNETLYRADSLTFPSKMVPTLSGHANFGGQGLAANFYDPVFQAVIYTTGTTGDPSDFPMKLYMDDEGFEKIIEHLQHVYRIVIAQTAAAIRIPLNATSPATSPLMVNGTLHYPGVWRLRQSGISTRILDGLLIAMAICVAISLVLMDTRGVLSKNPSSIAAGASFIAGRSDWLRDEMIQNAQWSDDSELKKNPFWSGLGFRLGWWDMESKEEVSKNFGLDVKEKNYL